MVGTQVSTNLADSAFSEEKGRREVSHSVHPFQVFSPTIAKKAAKEREERAESLGFWPGRGRRQKPGRRFRDTGGQRHGDRADKGTWAEADRDIKTQRETGR